MNWIKIEEIKNHKPKGNILVWQKNLSDDSCSRFQRAVFFKGNKNCCSFIKIYPIGNDNNPYKEDKEYKNYDLEGDMCQITHFAIIDAPIDNNDLPEKLIKVKATKDDSGHWYVIPNELQERFNLDSENEEFCDNGEFDKKYGQYRTGGSLNLIQLYANV